MLAHSKQMLLKLTYLVEIRPDKHCNGAFEQLAILLLDCC